MYLIVQKCIELFDSHERLQSKPLPDRHIEFQDFRRKKDYATLEYWDMSFSLVCERLQLSWEAMQISTWA
jgi:hypothetical protein